MKPPDQKRRTEIRRLYVEKGMSIRAIAAKLGVSFQAVQAMLERMGIARRPRGGNQGSHSRHRK